MIYLFFGGGQKQADHKLPFFWPKALLSAEWEGWADHMFKRSLATLFWMIFVFWPKERLNI